MNEELAELLRQAAELNGVLGEGYKQTAYDRAARVVEGITKDALVAMIMDGKLTELPGIGKGIAEKIAAFVVDGDCSWLEQYKESAGKIQPAPPKTAMVKAKSAEIERTGNLSLDMLRESYDQDKFNLLLPQESRAEIPDGFAVSVTALRITKGQTFKVDGGKLALNRVALSQVANAAGINWVAEERLDDHSNPLLCGYRVTGVVSDFDGRQRTVQGSKWIDLREDAGGGVPGKDFSATTSPKQRLQMAKYIDGHAITKAKNRAIRDILGLKSSYDSHELAKPFVVPRLVLDANDPMAKAAMIASAVGAQNAMFGVAEPLRQLERVTPIADPPPPENDDEDKF